MPKYSARLTRASGTNLPPLPLPVLFWFATFFLTSTYKTNAAIDPRVLYQTPPNPSSHSPSPKAREPFQHHPSTNHPSRTRCFLPAIDTHPSLPPRCRYPHNRLPRPQPSPSRHPYPYLVPLQHPRLQALRNMANRDATSPTLMAPRHG